MPEPVNFDSINMSEKFYFYRKDTSKNIYTMYTGPCNWRQLHFFSFFLSAFPFAIILYFLYNSKTKAMKTFAIHQLTNNVCKCAFKHDIFFLTSSPFFRFCSVVPVQTTRHYFWHYWMRPISTDTNLIPSAQVYHFRRKFMNRDFWREYVKYTNFAYVLARTHTFIVQYAHSSGDVTEKLLILFAKGKNRFISFLLLLGV